MITVNSILFSNNLRPSQPATNRLVGNAGDIIVATLNVTSTQAINDLEYFYNAVPNTQQIYIDNLTGGIFSTAFQSLTNNENQSYIRIGGVISSTTPKAHNSTISFVVNDLGGFIYEITHTFVLDPLLRENELDNTTFQNPSYYSQNGLKYVFKLNSISNGVTLETTDDVNLENTLNASTNTYPVFGNGAVTGWGSSLGTGAINYNLVVAPSLIDINANEITTHTAQIKKNNGAWVTSDLISYRLQEISEISGYNFTTTLLDNTKFDYVTHNVEDAPQDGANGYILECFCEIDGVDNTLLNVTFSITNNYANELAIFFACSSDILDLEHQNTLATYGTSLEQGSDSQVEFVNYAGFNQDFRIGFVNWYNQTFIDEGFNHLRAYRKDDNEVFFGVRLVNLDASFVSLECGFKNLDTNQFLTNEVFNFDFTTTLPLQVDRGYIRKDDNPKKYIQVAYVGDRYQFRYGFNVGAEFLESDNIVFEANVNFVDSNGFALTNTIQSPPIEAGQYDVTQNTIAEPQVLANPIPQPKFYLVDDTNTPDLSTEYNGLKAGVNMLLVSTFQDNNINDLQANEDDLAGFFAITTPNEIKETERYFFSTYDSESDTPFESVNGHTSGRVKVTKVDVKTATLSAIINYQKLIAAFPNQRDLCVVSRLDRPQPEALSYFKDISLHFTSSPNGGILITNPAVENWISQTFDFDGNHVTADFQFKINPTGAITKSDASWALYPYLSLASFEAESVLTGYTVRVECIDLNSKTDVLGCITYSSLTPTVTPFSGTHFRHKDSAINDFIAFYKEDVTIASLTVSNANRYYNVRDNGILNANSNLTNFLALNLVNLNAALALSAQKYGHFHNDRTTVTDKTTTITGSFGSGNREVIEYINPAKYQYAPFLSNPPALRYDRINDYVNFPSAILNWASIPNDSYIYIRACFNANITSSPRVLAASSFDIVNDGFITINDGSRRCSYPPLDRVTNLAGDVNFLNCIIRKKGDNGAAADLIHITDSFTVLNSFYRGYGILVNTSITPNISTQINLGGTYLNSNITQNAVHKLGFSILLAPPTLEECHRFCRGESVSNMQYEWDFTTLTGTQLTAIGTAGHGNANVSGNPAIGNLFD